MILGLSHIGVTTDDLSRAISCVERLGFSLEFVERDLPNNAAKVPFLITYAAAHDIAFLKSGAGSAGIELICYAETESPPEPRLEVEIRSAGLVQEECYDVLPGVRASATTGNSSIVGITIPSDSPDRACRFWEKGLGFRKTEQDDSGITVEPAMSLPLWKTKLRLIRDPRKPGDFQWKLDARGLNLLSFISTNPQEDSCRAKEYGAQLVSESFSLVVNQKELTIVLLYGAEGEPIELIKFSEVRK